MEEREAQIMMPLRRKRRADLLQRWCFFSFLFFINKIKIFKTFNNYRVKSII